MITPEEKRAILIRARARKFADFVRNEGHGFAHTIPDALVEDLSPAEVAALQEHLPRMRLVRREDWKWEASL